MERNFDIAIVGAGPAGLTAAIVAKKENPGLRVVILEKKEVAGKKLSATGNGRGNLSNKNCQLLPQILKFFSEVGIATRMDEEGRIYPYSEEAKAVTAALVKRAKVLGIEIVTDCQVRSVEADRKGSFRIFVCRGDNDKYANARECNATECMRSEKLLIATGGKSFAVYGSTGDGYALARSLGHSVVPPVPALTAIEVENPEDLKRIKGIRAKGEVSLFIEGNGVFKEVGEVQFREDSLSGICIMNMSSFLPVKNHGEGDGMLSKCRISINLVPDFSTVDLMEFLITKGKLEGINTVDLAETVVKGSLAEYVLERAGIDGQKPASELGSKELVAIANGLRNLSFVPCGRKGWKEAQVTKGGVSLKEIDMGTMESKVCPGLYFAGEVIDYDGPCGGYNLHNAWLTGIKAGKDMANHV